MAFDNPVDLQTIPPILFPGLLVNGLIMLYDILSNYSQACRCYYNAYIPMVVRGNKNSFILRIQLSRAKGYISILISEKIKSNKLYLFFLRT